MDTSCKEKTYPKLKRKEVLTYELSYEESHKKNSHEYGLPRGQKSPYLHRVHTVRTLQKSA